jgi:oxygen-dependent protoporphyrinogen oxidase
MEYFVPARREPGEESLADFTRRRLGPEGLAKLIDPMASGIYAGNPEEMSLQACFPKVDLLEQRFGGMLKGMTAMQKEAAKAGRRGPEGAGPGGVLNSFRFGLTQLIEAVVATIGPERIETGAAAERVETIPGGYRVTSGKRSFECRALVLASPSYVTSSLLLGLDAPLSDEIGRIPYCRVAVVGLGYRREDLDFDTAAFGYLIPSGEGRRILGTLYDSSIFPNRAPEGHVLLRSIIGGARRPDLVDLSSEQLTELTRDELRDILGIKAAPVVSEVVHWHKAIPQYRVGHLARLSRIEARRATLPGLFLTGNSYRGVGINDCTADAELVAPAVVTHLSR